MRVLYAILMIGLYSGVYYPIHGQDETDQTSDVQDDAGNDTDTTTDQETVPDQPATTEQVPAESPATQAPSAQTESPEPITEEANAPAAGTESTGEESTEESAAPAETEAPTVSETPPSAPSAMPAPAPAPQEPKEEETLEIRGIDTLESNEPKGNWLLKRIWWENAERSYEKIKQLKQKVIDSRMSFFQKRSEFDRTILDPFYIKIGVGQGELKEILSSLLAMIEQMRTSKGSLNEQERELLKSLELEQETLNGLEQKLQTVTEIDNAIDDALLKLIEQINRAHDYEQKGWESFKTITRELSDKRARELYYSLEGDLKNVRAIGDYIQKEFTPYFDQLIQRAQSLIDEMDASIQTLKEKGIDIKMQAQKLNQEQEEQKKEAEEKQAPQRSGWLSPLYNIWDAIVETLSSLWNYITSFFGSSKPQPVEVKEEVKEVVATDETPTTAP